MQIKDKVRSVRDHQPFLPALESRAALFVVLDLAKEAREVYHNAIAFAGQWEGSL